ncbi:DUF2273 domain-containing protein [Halanaerobiaceae bacterium Z-7014]|uniref:DUF2273 domain-containing protein n=1 Tax=Halonatronomonas betaini TaxID=2778430 RepID=A0A931ARB7_9FIRM|nr:DUF2273 domain-containing protein [Halonatronomonas betaini]MBF8437568.1 DUF2273 domain-containing protein [Halonatronomonas betaini]
MNGSDSRPELKELFKEFIFNYRSEITGALLGLILAILIFTIGIFKTLVILAFTVIGFLIGNRDDLNDDIVKILNRVLNK